MFCSYQAPGSLLKPPRVAAAQAKATREQSLDDLILKQVEYVDANWLYNFLQTQGGSTLLDVRHARSFADGHIGGFHSVPPIWKVKSLEQVEKRVSDTTLAHLRRRKLTTIVLYDQEGDAASHRNTWALQLAKFLITEGACLGVKYLQGGFSEFKLRFPFLIMGKLRSGRRNITAEMKTTAESASAPLYRTKSGLHTVPYPNEILEDFLYLGNKWQATHLEMLAELGITHVVSACIDFPKEFIGQDRITVFHIPVKDKVSAPLNEYFEGTYQFISGAEAAGGKVLIHCEQGISRSATLAIAYLCYRMNWSLVCSYNYVLRRRNLIYPNVGFLNQLVQEEIDTFGCTSIRDTSELDLLQNGLLSDRSLSSPLCLFRRAFLPKRFQTARCIRRLIIE